MKLFFCSISPRSPRPNSRVSAGHGPAPINFLAKKAPLLMYLLCVLATTSWGCRAKFGFKKGTQRPLQIHTNGLTVNADRTSLYTRGNPGSVITLEAQCSVPGTITVSWDLGDGAQKTGTKITHDYEFANNYTIKANCTNTLGDRADKTIYVAVDYRHPETGDPTRGPTARCEFYWDEKAQGVRGRNCKPGTPIPTNTCGYFDEERGGIIYRPCLGGPQRQQVPHTR